MVPDYQNGEKESVITDLETIRDSIETAFPKIKELSFVLGLNRAINVVYRDTQLALGATRTILPDVLLIKNICRCANQGFPIKLECDSPITTCI